MTLDPNEASWGHNAHAYSLEKPRNEFIRTHVSQKDNNIQSGLLQENLDLWRMTAILIKIIVMLERRNKYQAFFVLSRFTSLGQ